MSKGNPSRGVKGTDINTNRFERDFLSEHTNTTLPDGPMGSQWMDRYMQQIGVAIIASIGIPLNVLCIFVLCRRMKKSQKIYKIFTGFIVLATLDVFLLLLMSTNHAVNEFFPQHRHIITTYVTVQRYFMMLFDKSLSSLVVLISLNRLLVILKPLKCKEFVIVKHVGKVAMGLVTTVALLVILLQLEDKSARPSYGQDVTKTPLGHYTTVITFLFGIIFSFVLMIINVMLTLQFTKTIRQRAALSSTIQMNNARIIHVGAAIGMSAIYLLNAVPQSVLETLEVIKSKRFGEHADVFTQANQLSFMMKALSAACYGPLFLITSKDNRDELFRMIACCRCWSTTPPSALSNDEPVTHTTKVKTVA